MDSIVAIQKRLPDVKILGYWHMKNTVEEIGVDRFIEFCLTNNLKDILLVGLKDDIIKNKIIAAGLQVSCYVQFLYRKKKWKWQNNQMDLYIYRRSRMIHSKKNEEYPTLKDCVEYLRSCGIEKTYLLWGRRSAPEDVRLVREAGGDAAFVGSTILKTS